eukprot:6049210-Ditylum_brightwellii.AAC.1
MEYLISKRSFMDSKMQEEHGGSTYQKEDIVVMLMKELSERFDITGEGKTVEEYLGVKIDCSLDRSFRM